MLDAELVRRKMRLILEDLERLRPFANKTLEAYLADPLDEIVAERLLERIVGRMIDVNYHLCVALVGLPPKDYHESFLKLGELGILTSESARSLAKAAGVRNRLAHEYNGIDATLVHAACRAALVDVPAFIAAVEAHLDRTGTP